jgi:type IV pilus assembly protein PilQ
MNKKFTIICLLTISMVSYLIADNDTGSEEIKYPNVSIHAQDTHLPSILAILAEESGFNIVTGPNFENQNKLTIHLDNVPIDQALNLVIRAAGLSYEIVGNSILVANQSKLSEDVGVSPHVISLKYANANDIATLLKNVTENITVDQSGNNLLVSASPKKINEIRDIVDEVDIPTTQIMLEARLIEVTIGDQKEMGFDWERLAQTTLVFAEATDPVRMGNLTYNGSIPGASPSTYNEGTDDEYISETFSGTPLNLLPQEMPWSRNLDDINPFGRQLTAFDVTLDMLLKDNQADILTNSQVVTVNGQEATIEMVDVIPYLASSGGIGGQMQIMKETVGIKLHILPYVNSDGYITTEITPELSSIISWTAQGYPWTKKRTSTTTVRVLDGETIVIAGLVTTEEVEVTTKVPVLWRIPIIGKRWFSHNEVSEKKTDLIIQVKPTIVKDNYSGIDKKYYHMDAEGRMLDD